MSDNYHNYQLLLAKAAQALREAWDWTTGAFQRFLCLCQHKKPHLR